MSFVKTVGLVALIACGAVVRAQDAATDALVQRAVANVQRYHATLPSITADESIQSGLSQHGFYMAHGKAEATLRVTAGKPGEQLNETRTFRTVDGKVVTQQKSGVIPFEMHGAFSRIADGYLSEKTVVNYVFTRLAAPAADGSVQLSFVRAQSPVWKDHHDNVSGLVRIDPETAQVRHIERTVVPAPEDKHTVTFLSVDYAPAKIGAETFWLPTRIIAALDGKKGRFEATYSNYHRYTASSTIVSVEEPLPESATP